MFSRLMRRIRDEYRALRAHSAIVEQECRHDGSEPMCMRCTQDATGW